MEGDIKMSECKSRFCNGIFHEYSINEEIRKAICPYFLQKLARLEHEQWLAWSQNIASKETLSEERLDRWRKLWCQYDDLTKVEQMQDLEWARHTSDLILHCWKS